jgi:hypothetical protein
MTIQSILRMMAQTAKEILIALYESLARFGCGLEGIPYED